MQRLMRKYRNIIFVFILLFIGLPMLFFGIPEFLNSREDSSGDVLGMVGTEKLYESVFLQRLDTLARRYGSPDKPKSYAELKKDGHTDTVMHELVDGLLIDNIQKDRGFSASDATAAELLKDDFKDDNGNFDKKTFDTWRDTQSERGMNWNKWYESLHLELNRKVFVNLATATANRVTEKDIDNALTRKYEKVRLRYTKVSPPVTLSDADIQAHYESNQKNYSMPEQRIAQFIAVPIATARPTKADEAFKALAAGEEFAAVADKFSDQEVKNGGDLDWQTPSDNDDAHIQKLFALGVGEVSELISAPQGYFIYKVEEERTNPDNGKREVKARQIFLLNPSASEEERTAQSAKMEEVVAEANANGLDAAATKFQFPVQVSGAFDKDSASIENIPNDDASEFRKKLNGTNPDSTFIAIKGRVNNYCAKVTEVVPGAARPLEEVREQVITDAKKEKASDKEFRKRAKAYAYKIGREIKSLEDIKNIYPGIEMEIKETTEPLGAQDNLYKQGFMVVGDLVFKELEGKEVGQVVGPIQDFSSDYYFVELLERIPPTEEEKANFEEDRKALRDDMFEKYKAKYFEDYRKKMREVTLANFAPDIDQARLDKILSTGEDAKEEGGADTEAKAADTAAVGSASTSAPVTTTTTQTVTLPAPGETAPASN